MDNELFDSPFGEWFYQKNLDLLKKQFEGKDILVELSKKAEEGEFHRACGDTICRKCERLYKHHPQLPTDMWLTVICNKDLVKL